MKQITMDNKIIQEVLSEQPDLINHECANDAYIISQKIKKDIFAVPELQMPIKKLATGIDSHIIEVDLFDDLFVAKVILKKNNKIMSILNLTYGLDVARLQNAQEPEIQIDYKGSYYTMCTLCNSYEVLNNAFEDIDVNEIKQITGLYKDYVIEYIVKDGGLCYV